MAKYEDPDWPSAATEEGQVLRLAAGLSEPGNPRRAKLMLLCIAGMIALFVVLALLLS